MPGNFIDTNILLYTLSGDTAKANRAEAVLRGGGVVSVQVLNEMANVLRRKQRVSWAQVRMLLETMRGLLTVVPLTLEIHEAGLRLGARHGLSVYDAMIAAAALVTGCDVLWSEDMHDGLVIEQSLRITNPFREVI